jgi:protein gp37
MTESFIESCNVLNSILFENIGVTKSAEALWNWGVRGGETGYELKSIAKEFIDHIKS